MQLYGNWRSYSCKIWRKDLQKAAHPVDTLCSHLDISRYASGLVFLDSPSGASNVIKPEIETPRLAAVLVVVVNLKFIRDDYSP